ncbi:MAG: hypothetical protein J6A28_04230 [Clostridia bacterium]|nr:hypothetical protein [Clostridia bacterium]
MAYYKISLKAGHFGNGRYGLQTLYVRAEDVLSAFDYARRLPSIKHHRLPLNAEEVGEDEFIINACINAAEKCYSGEIIPLDLQKVKQRVLKTICIDEKVNKAHKSGRLKEELVALCQECDNAQTDEQRKVAEEKLSNWIKEKYDNQHTILEEESSI